MKIHLVDGTFELFRCFHGAPRRRDAEGREVGAAVGLLWTLVSLLRQEDTTHVAIAFDRMAPPKKGDRCDDAALRSQNALAADIMRALGVVIWPMVKLQADDALATAAKRFAAFDRVDQVVICTRDKDLAQCVIDDRIVVRDRVAKITLDQRAVVAKFGVLPSSIPDYLGLVGDPADGLPGVPGWGATSTAKILRQYHTLEQIPLDHTRWTVKIRGAKRLAETLADRFDEAILFRNLAVLRDDVPLPHHQPEQLAWRGADRDRLLPLVARLDEPDVLEKIPAWR